MSALAWTLAAAGCAVMMMAASRAAIAHAVALSVRLRVSPFIVGITLVALGTDMPELVNSVVSSRLGHGDINVGDSIGSVFAQGTLILGILPFAAHAPLPVVRRQALLLCGLCVLALLIGLGLVRDGSLTRHDAALLVSAWVAAVWTAWRLRVVDLESPDAPDDSLSHPAVHAAKLLALLAAVGAGAAGLVHAIAAVSASLGVPEYLLSFFGAALGTSLPELTVDLTAMRRGHRQIALGGILGACLMDATLSLGAGPLLFPTPVSAALAVEGAAVALAGMTLATLLLAARGRHDRWSGGVLLAAYLSGYLLVFIRK